MVLKEFTLPTIVNQLKKSATLAINELVVEMRTRHEEIYHLGFGESPFPVMPKIAKALCDHADKKSYLPSQGLFVLRQSISNFFSQIFDLHYDPREIIVGPGSKSLLFGVLLSLDGPLLLPSPSWVSYQHQARIVRRPLHYLQTTRENSYLLLPSTLESALESTELKKARQKMLLLNSPCNPTGQMYDKSTLKQIADLCREHDVIVLSDEIYGLITYGSIPHHSIAEFYPEGTIIFSGLSKDRSLGGYRVGVALIPEHQEHLMTALTSIASETWSCVPAPIQHAAIEAYQPTEDIMTYIRDCTTIHGIMTRYLHEHLVSAGVYCPSPQGAFYLFPDWNDHAEILHAKNITNSHELAAYLLKEWKVAALPGAEFGRPPEDLTLRMASVDYDGQLALQHYQQFKDDVMANPEQYVETVAPRLAKACINLKAFMESLE